MRSISLKIFLLIALFAIPHAQTETETTVGQS
jgi:hypothetical protein